MFKIYLYWVSNDSTVQMSLNHLPCLTGAMIVQLSTRKLESSVYKLCAQFSGCEKRTVFTYNFFTLARAICKNFIAFIKLLCPLKASCCFWVPSILTYRVPNSQ